MVASSTVCVGFMMSSAFLEKEAWWYGNVQEMDPLRMFLDVSSV